MKRINTDLAGYIGSWSITELIDKIDEVNEDVEIDWNTVGGSVYAGQKFIDYTNSRKNKLNANVTGIVASMGAVILPFFNHVKGAKQADVMIHAMSGGVDENIDHSNKFLYKALSKKINKAKFKEITGKELKDVMFANRENRVDIWLTGEQAGEIGLFDEVYDLLDGKAATLNVDSKELDYELPENIAVKYGFKEKKNQIIIKNDMEVKDITADILKKENVAVHSSIADGAKTAERKRVASIMKYAQYDMEKANEIIESGAELSIADVEHFMEKKFNTTELDNLENGSEGELKVAKVTKDKKVLTEQEKEKEVALGSLRDQLGTSDLLDESKKS